MGFFAIILRFASYGILFALATVSLASGLYYLAELVEEYERLTKKIIRYSVYAVMVILVLMWLFESYPFFYILVALASHFLYFQLLRRFPHIELTNMLFIISCVMLMINHAVWFSFFSQSYRPFEEVVAFFMICVWLVPFSFFISMTANEDTLPYGSTISAAGEPLTADGAARKPRVNRLVSLFQWLKRKQEEIIPVDSFRSRRDTKTF
eukprot:TRINITY_DN1852_c0_g1_i1.p1 TRINITY_DN1852_c0_g1~~TRINITY_DN1852_c0_g1_i1.p1  ORF type:complete len:209 (-),score=44.82 TRINITY_DN1852_c0_g1_i1:131-757(-)